MKSRSWLTVAFIYFWSAGSSEKPPKTTHAQLVEFMNIQAYRSLNGPQFEDEELGEKDEELGEKKPIRGTWSIKPISFPALQVYIWAYQNVDKMDLFVCFCVCVGQGEWSLRQGFSTQPWLSSNSQRSPAFVS